MSLVKLREAKPVTQFFALSSDVSAINTGVFRWIFSVTQRGICSIWTTFVQKSSKSFLPETFCEAESARAQWKSAGASPQIPLGELTALPQTL